MSLFQIKEFFFIFWVREIFRQLLDLSRDLFKIIRRRLFLRFSQEIASLSFFLLIQWLNLSPISRLRPHFLFLPFKKDFIIHPSLNNKERCCNKRFLKQLSLEHFDQMLNPKFLSLLSNLLGSELLLRILLSLLLLKQTYFRWFFQRELGVFAIDTFGVDLTAGLFELDKDFNEVFDVDFARSNQS